MPAGDFGHVAELPDEIRDAFMQICQEMGNLSVKWRLYLDLFGEEDTRSLLHDAAYSAFNAIEESIRIDVTMTICRLADPEKSMGRENLSFARIAAFFSQDAQLQKLVDDFNAACKLIVIRRNKLVAHNDFNTKLAPQSNLVPGVARPDVENIIMLAALALNHVVRVHTGGEIRFDPPRFLDGRDLVFWLRKGWEARRQTEREREC
jgi:hypothetical protein